MRVLGVALLSGVVLLGACGGGESQNAATDSAATAAPAATPAPTSGVAAAPATGTIHVVNMMLVDGTKYVFEPANITVKPGDGIKFVNVSGGPHNVAFDAATIPADQKDQLFANMPNSMDGSSPMFVTPNEEWILSLGNIAPGKYPFHCTPHLAMGMKGEITVQP